MAMTSERERRKCLEVLGLPHSSSEDDIKKAYRRLALQYHPDKNTEDGAKEQFQEISYAYKYLIEGPEAVGAEEDDDGIPLEVLLRLFPWLFAGGRFFHPGFHGFHPAFHHFHDPFFPGFYDDVYVDSDESYDEYCYVPSEPRPKSTYVPGLSKEERRKEKKKKAKERRKAAKISKPQASPKPKKDTQPAQTTSATTGTGNAASKNLKSTGCASYTDDINIPDLKEKSSPRPTAESVKLQSGSHDSSTSVGATSNNSQSKKSKKKLKQEQKKREKEMESIANEFKKKQQQQAEKEARREAARQERKGRETTLKTQEAEGSIADSDSVITGNDDSESIRTDFDIEDEAARAEVIDGEVTEEDEDVDYDGDDTDLEIDGKEDVPKANRGKGTMHGQSTNTQKSGSVNSSAPRSIPDGGHQTRQGQKTQYKDNRSSSRGSEASGTSVTSDRQRQTSKKIKRHGRQKEAEWEDWNDLEGENSSPYEGLMPQSEAEEMRMFHKAILMSEREAQQQGKKESNKNKSSSSSVTTCDELSIIDDVSCSGTDKGVIPQTQEEERIMLETALRESEITAHWHGNIDTIDDVSDGEDDLSGDSAFSGASAGAVGDWHKLIGNNTSFLKQKKEKVKSRSQFKSGKINLSSGHIKLGGLGSGSSGFSDPKDSGVKNGQKGQVEGQSDFSVNGSLESQFDRTVGGKVKAAGKTKADSKKKGDNSWEFGGSGSSKTVFKTDDVEGLQFGIDEDMTFVNGSDHFSTAHQSEFKGNIQSKMSSAYNKGSPGQKSQKKSAKQTGSRNMTEDIQSQIRSQILAQLNHPKASDSTGLPKESNQSVPSSKESQHGSSHTGNNGNVSSTQNVHSVIYDMDDIDDVDTFGESSGAPAFSLPAEPASSFDLNIPAALCNKEKIKSYYQRKK